MAEAWDLLVRGGTLIDPARSIATKRDVAFSGGTVAAVAETLTGDGIETIDATGGLVTPGLIDIHTHVYRALSTGRHPGKCLSSNPDCPFAGRERRAGLRKPDLTVEPSA